jgi:hypothetical protein
MAVVLFGAHHSFGAALVPYPSSDILGLLPSELAHNNCEISTIPHFTDTKLRTARRRGKTVKMVSLTAMNSRGETFRFPQSFSSSPT